MDASAETLIDLDAVTGNVAALLRHVGGPAVMAVVKSDGYGHGMIPGARAALAGGAGWLGVISIDEALALRGAGLTAPVLALMGVPGAPHEEAIRQTSISRPARWGWSGRSPPRRAGQDGPHACT